MSGRIKLLKNGKPVNAEPAPAIPYEYDKPGAFDKQCGTFGLDAFQLPHEECLSKYVCDVPENNPDLRQFSDCIDAMDCSMMAGMTTGVSADSTIALFNHQMVPHHQNAVNMAKALLKSGKVVCADITDEDSDMCVMEQILYEIVNNQNYQIQLMRSVNEELTYPQTDDCKVIVSPNGGDNVPNGTSSSFKIRLALSVLISALGVLITYQN